MIIFLLPFSFFCSFFIIFLRKNYIFSCLLLLVESPGKMKEDGKLMLGGGGKSVSKKGFDEDGRESK